MEHKDDKKMGEWVESLFASCNTLKEKQWLYNMLVNFVDYLGLTDENDLSSELSGIVLRTKDYSMFKRLQGNRDVLEQRKKKIKKSVLENGVLFCPITTNENMEIIDGNGRFEVFSEMDAPIDYIIKKGLTKKECVIFNSTSTPWALTDYIRSYASDGDENYIRLEKLLKTHPLCGIASICFAIDGNITHKYQNGIKAGEYTVTEQQYIAANSALAYAEMFLDNFRCGGNKVFLLNAVIFAYSLGQVDKKKLIDKWNTYGALQTVSNPVVTIDEALSNLERAYNYKSREGKTVYLKPEYDKYMRSKNAAYAKRWSEKRK